MFPLTIKDLPVEAWDVIVALGLVPVKLTNDYDPELYWSVFADSDYLSDDTLRSFLFIPGGSESDSFIRLPEQDKRAVLPPTVARPFIQMKFDNDTFFQLSIPFNG